MSGSKVIKRGWLNSNTWHIYYAEHHRKLVIESNHVLLLNIFEMRWLNSNTKLTLQTIVTKLECYSQYIWRKRWLNANTKSAFRKQMLSKRYVWIQTPNIDITAENLLEGMTEFKRQTWVAMLKIVNKWWLNSNTKLAWHCSKLWTSDDWIQTPNLHTTAGYRVQMVTEFKHLIHIPAEHLQNVMIECCHQSWISCLLEIIFKNKWLTLNT